LIILLCFSILTQILVQSFNSKPLSYQNCNIPIPFL
jgi:hypothetical protein